MRLASAIAFLVMVLHAPSLVAQSSAPAAGTVINGQVTVHLTITLRESANDYGPIADHPLILYRSTGDSLQIRTDDTGVLRFLIAPGSYRLVSAAPAQWRGRGYRWNVPLEV